MHTYPHSTLPKRDVDMKQKSLLVLILGISLSWGCGGDDTDGTSSGHSGGGHGGTGATSGAGTGGSSTSGSSTGGGTSDPQAPIITSVGPLEGVLHVTWTNVTPDCDKIQLDRKRDDGPYATAYTLAGAADSQHDTQAVPPGTYCYKARCEKGGKLSPDSNEKCGTP
jgi:hypothetical protein